MAQSKQPAPQTPQNDDTAPTSAQNTDGSADDTELASAVAAQVEQATGKPVDPTPAPTPGDTVKLEDTPDEKTKPAAQKTAKSDDGETDKPRKRTNGSAANGTANGKSHDDPEPVRRDRQIAQGRQQDDEPGYGRQVRRDEADNRPSARRGNDQRNLFGDEDDGYYDRRPRSQDQGRDEDYDRGRRAAQGYGHTAPHDDTERMNREYGSDYRRYSDAGYDDRNQYRSRDRAFDQSPYGDRDRYYSEGGQYRQRPHGYRPNDNGRDFEREAREQPRNRWRESNVDPRYDDAYDNHRNRPWSSQGNLDRYSRERDDRERYQDQSRDRGYGTRDERGRDEPVAGNRSNYPAAREDDRGNPTRWRDDRRDYRENEADDRYEYDRAPPWRRR